MISKKNLSVIIVSFASDEVIFDCIESIDNEINIIVIENSRNAKLKSNLENKYKNVKCFLNDFNSGMGAGNNYGLSKINTDYALILNPDVRLEKSTLNEIFEKSKKIQTYSILAPIHLDTNYPNYKINKNSCTKEETNILDVISIDGYAMLLNIKRIEKALNIHISELFDENIFMYLENDDLCKRLIDRKEKIFIIKSSRVKHLGAKGVSEKFKYQVELSRNWHWSWSRFYYKKKHYSFFNALINETPKAINSLFKILIYFFFNKTKKEIHINKFIGFFYAMLGKPSTFRPKIDLDNLNN